MNLTDALIDFALSDFSPSPRAQQIVTLSALDWAACGIAGAEDGLFQRWAAGQAAYGFAPVFAGDPLTAPAAALVNGTLSHALDFDDTHFAHIGHPSVVVMSAVLAAKPASWTAFQEAALVGIEASIRIGIWLGRDHYQRGFHQTATAGALGACVGLIRLHGLPPNRARAALGLCATMASGLKAQFGTMGKPLNAGLAARAGVEAAQWAQGGMSGPDAGLEAFAAAHDAACDEAAVKGLGTAWEIETLSHKFHACCHGLHATLEALRGLDRGAVQTVERVEVDTHPRWMTVCNHAEPQSGLEAKFSYRQVVAMALSSIDTGDITSFTDEVAQDETLTLLRGRVHVTADETLSETQARVRVIASDGTVALFHDLAAQVDLEELSERLRLKSKALVGAERGAALWLAIQAQDIDAFKVAAFGTAS